MKHIKIVPMAAEHLNDVAALELACFSRPWSRQMLAEELDNQCAAFLVALEPETEKVIGYAGLLVAADEGYITNVAVDPSRRRQGVAAQLLQVFDNFARGNQLAFLTLEVRGGPPPQLLRPTQGGCPDPDEILHGGGGAMNILAFESSCDETAVAVVRDGRTLLSDAILSQADMHALYGGVVPEIASRKHVHAIAALTDKALADAGLAKKDIDAVAVTYAPGLIGAVLVGVSFAKSAAYALGVPLIPVHHVRGHIAANYLAFPELEPPFVALAISGGNTLIVDVADYTDMTVLGATRDDAAGECFDKAARVLGLPYPGGRPMDQLAQQSAGGVYDLPSAHVAGAELDMSFSGLKTAVVNLAHNAQQKGDPLDAPALARDFARAVSGELVPRAMRALELTGRRTLVAAGGVAANSVIRADLHAACGKAGVRLFLPPLKWCGDNGAMIGAQGYYEYQAGRTAGLDLNAYATMDLGAPLL